MQKREFGFCVALKTTNSSNESGGLLLVTAVGGNLDEACSTLVILGRMAAVKFLGRRFPDKKEELAALLHLYVESLKPSNKGGSSGGLAAAISFLSLALQKPVKQGVAVTGATASNGDVKLNGIGQKVTAAMKSPVTRIILPKLNEEDFQALQIELSSKIEVIYDQPLFEMDFPPKKREQQQETHHLLQFIAHAALDIVDEQTLRETQMYFKIVDKFNEWFVSAFVTASRIRFLMLHTQKNEDGIKQFFQEIYEMYIKFSMNPFYRQDTPIRSPSFDQKAAMYGRKFLGLLPELKMVIPSSLFFLMEIRKTKTFSVSPSSLSDSPPNSSADIASSLPSGDDEVYDTAFISRGSNCVAVATNSAELRIHCLDSGESVGIGHGHSQSILCVDSPSWDDQMIASGSKDNSIFFWRIGGVKTGSASDGHQNFTNAFMANKIAMATGHTHSVASVAFSHSKSLPFLVSVSTDTTLKLWPLSELIVKQEKGEQQQQLGDFKLSASATVVAHSKDINSVDISANDRLCVTASMDKSAKLWHIDRKTGQLSAGGTLGGHKRGVWCARFSKNQQLVATCSGDLTIKLFSLLDKTCTRTLEGHQFAVLSILFIDNGSKLVSVDGGGLIKLWDVKKGICVRTEEAHSDKIWSLRELLPAEEEKNNSIGLPKMRFMTGAADGQFAIWTDISEEVKAEKRAEQTKRTEDEQRLSNLLDQDRLGDALLLTLDLAQPFQCLTVLNKLAMDGPQSEESDAKLLALFRRLSAAQLSILLDYAAQWNTNTRTYAVAQLVLNCVLKCVHPEQLLKLPNIGDVVKTFLPYSLRHYGRLTTQRKKVSQLNYTFSCMRLN
ncbi:hypothetical protein niasHT_028121 [Heterodera trifolii]|uniref:Uncharacterized protein n=1 Tax=Heterodera trifolii TaxID=157864 RepID=A0ABD2JP77_9BILA